MNRDLATIDYDEMRRSLLLSFFGLPSAVVEVGSCTLMQVANVAAVVPDLTFTESIFSASFTRIGGVCL